MAEITGLRLAGGKGEIIFFFFHFMIEMKRKEEEVADCCCQSVVSARVLRGTGSLWATSRWVLPPSLMGTDATSACACQFGSLNKPLGIGR